MSNYFRVAWNPKERVARAAAYLDDYFRRYQYGVRFDGDAQVYRPGEVEIPIDLVLVPRVECHHVANAGDLGDMPWKQES